MKKIKIGQIGLGHNHGEAKMIGVRKFPELFEVVGYSEKDEEWIKKRGSCKGYEGLKRYNEDELIDMCDALLIETDIWELTETALKCIKKGKHIHMDKPASGTLEEYKQLLDMAKEKNLVVQLGYMYRYNPAIVKCMEMIKNGELGEIYAINAEMSVYHGEAYKKWLRNFKGGTMFILGSNLLDLIVYIMGKPNKVTSFIKQTGLDGILVDDNNFAVLEYDKAICKINTSSVEVNGYGRRQFVVSGSKGTACIMPIENPCKMWVATKDMTSNIYSDVKQKIEIDDNTKDGRYDDVLRDFYDYVCGKKENPYTYEHDYAVQETLARITDGIVFNSKNKI